MTDAEYLEPTRSMLADLDAGQVDKARWGRFWAELEATVRHRERSVKPEQLCLFEGAAA